MQGLGLERIPWNDLVSGKWIHYGEDLDVDGRIILEWILGKWDWNLWTGCIWLRVGTNGRLL
jgi:hypothetical protein